MLAMAVEGQWRPRPAWEERGSLGNIRTGASVEVYGSGQTHAEMARNTGECGTQWG